MRSCTIIGAVFYLISTTLALPLIPHVTSDPSSSIVERRWDPVSLLRRIPSSRQVDTHSIQPEPGAHLKSSVLRFYTDNPVAKSLFTKPTILDRGVDASHQEESAWAKRGEETKTTDYPVGAPKPSTGSPETATASESDLKDPYANRLDLGGNKGLGPSYGWLFRNKMVDGSNIGK